MVCSTFSIPLGLILLSTAVLSEITITLNYDPDLASEMSKKYDIRGGFELTCAVKGVESKFSTRWEKEGKSVNSIISSERLTESHDKGVYKMKVLKAIEGDAGTYSCIVFNAEEEFKRANITLISRYRVKTPDSINVVEGETLRIPCAVHGKPAPTISWTIGNETYEDSRGRIKLEDDKEREVENAILVIQDVNMGDRGVYTCTGTPSIGPSVSDESMIRVKDKYAALWPFLGICAEVFILCAIILIYEKKRNKAELEESDTDQSPDQKNTPDHGKDSNLRHRQ